MSTHNGHGALDVVIVGAGVVGLACARALALRGREVYVLEAEPRLGVHTSGRSSEVIHAGLYYPTGSLKARLCVQGRAELLAYCIARGIAHRLPGKLLVATGERELATLEAIARRAEQNGLHDLVPLTGSDARKLEPALACDAALHSPSTGIVDSHGLMQALLADARAAGATLVLRSPVLGGHIEDDGFRLDIGGASPMSVQCRALINAAGPFAPRLSGALVGLSAEHTPHAHFAKGHYFALSGPSPFGRLIYPMPDEHGLGIHLTLDLSGRARFGPDVHWTRGVDYAFEASQAHFVTAIRRYYPALAPERLLPDYTGVRPKLSGPGDEARDFVVQHAEVHGIPGLVQLFGIESPGLTAALALADHVSAYLT